MKGDFDYLFTLISGFFEQKHIQNRLKIIHECKDKNTEKCKITGWETWLQIEFSVFLAEHNTEPDWHRELTLPVDKRTKSVKSTMRPDFLIRKKGWRQYQYMALEMKIHQKPKSCIHNLFSDLNKLGTMRPSALEETRTHWGLAVFPTQDPNDESITDFIAYKAKDLGWGSAFKNTKSQLIRGTPYSYLIL